ncbi:MAG: hypothetical protein U0U67_15915 [Chitinophagales bacterium]
MNYINETEKIFNSLEKWNAYLELIEIKRDIISKWYNDLEESIKNKVNEIEHINDWKFIHYDINEFGWYLNGYEEGSITIFNEYNQLNIWVNGNKFNTNDILFKYKDSKLFNSYFNEADEIGINNSYLAKSKRVSINGIRDYDSLAYYANKEKKEHIILTKIISDFFIHFMNDPEIIGIIRNINEDIKLQ